MSLWSHPRIENAFAARNEWAAMAHEAVMALTRRQESYPTAVDNGHIEKDVANTDIAAWQAIVDDWNWISAGPAEQVSGSEFPAHFAALEAKAFQTINARIDALDTAIDRFFTKYDHADSRHASPGQIGEMRRQVTLLASMRCWAECEVHLPPPKQARFFASIGHEFRARTQDHKRIDIIPEEQRSIAA